MDTVSEHNRERSEQERQKLQTFLTYTLNVKITLEIYFLSTLTGYIIEFLGYSPEQRPSIKVTNYDEPIYDPRYGGRWLFKQRFTIVPSLSSLMLRE